MDDREARHRSRVETVIDSPERSNERSIPATTNPQAAFITQLQTLTRRIGSVAGQLSTVHSSRASHQSDSQYPHGRTRGDNESPLAHQRRTSGVKFESTSISIGGLTSPIVIMHERQPTPYPDLKGKDREPSSSRMIGISHIFRKFVFSFLYPFVSLCSWVSI